MKCCSQNASKHGENENERKHIAVPLLNTTVTVFSSYSLARKGLPLTPSLS